MKDVPQIPLPEGVPTFTGSMGLYKTMPGHLPTQLLNNDFDVFWVRSGEAQWQLKDGTTLRARRDQFVVLPPFVPAWVDETAAPMSFWYCHFAFRPIPERLTPNPPSRRADYLGPGAHAATPLFFTRRDAPGVHRAYRQLTLLKLGSPEPWQFERGIIALIAELARFAQGRKSRRPDAPRFEIAPLDNRVIEIRRRVDEDPTFDWSVAGLAQSAGVTPGHLHALSRRVLGKSMKRYIVESRLRHAMLLLKQKRDGEPLSIFEVSEACGFSSQHFFSRQFKSYFNMSPLEYRNGSALT
jgi:AraC-like DNA-binding protein